MSTIRPPLFISSRLMAALRIVGVGTIHLCADRCDKEDRILYRYIVEDADGCQLGAGCNFRSGVGEDVDYTRTMCTLLAFLADDAEQTGTVAQEWAYRHADRLDLSRMELELLPPEYREGGESDG